MLHSIAVRVFLGVATFTATAIAEGSECSNKAEQVETSSMLQLRSKDTEQKVSSNQWPEVFHGVGDKIGEKVVSMVKQEEQGIEDEIHEAVEAGRNYVEAEVDEVKTLVDQEIDRDVLQPAQKAVATASAAEEEEEERLKQAASKAVEAAGHAAGVTLSQTQEVLHGVKSKTGETNWWETALANAQDELRRAQAEVAEFTEAAVAAEQNAEHQVMNQATNAQTQAEQGLQELVDAEKKTEEKARQRVAAAQDAVTQATQDVIDQEKALEDRATQAANDAEQGNIGKAVADLTPTTLLQKQHAVGANPLLESWRESLVAAEARVQELTTELQAVAQEEREAVQQQVDAAREEATQAAERLADKERELEDQEQAAERQLAEAANDAAHGNIGQAVADLTPTTLLQKQARTQASNHRSAWPEIISSVTNKIKDKVTSELTEAGAEVAGDLAEQAEAVAADVKANLFQIEQKLDEDDDVQEVKKKLLLLEGKALNQQGQRNHQEQLREWPSWSEMRQTVDEAMGSANLQKEIESATQQVYGVIDVGTRGTCETGVARVVEACGESPCSALCLAEREAALGVTYFGCEDQLKQANIPACDETPPPMLLAKSRQSESHNSGGVDPFADAAAEIGTAVTTAVTNEIATDKTEIENELENSDIVNEAKTDIAIVSDDVTVVEEAGAQVENALKKDADAVVQVFDDASKDPETALQTVWDAAGR